MKTLHAMLNILDKEQLEYQPMTLKQRWRINNTSKEFAVFVGDDLYIVKDDKNLNRLFYERLRAESIYKAFIYCLK